MCVTIMEIIIYGDKKIKHLFCGPIPQGGKKVFLELSAYHGFPIFLVHTSTFN